ncbi:MAG: Gfo/Idh/MocA family oxidoreductase [Chthonomonadales bacterium]|nr:Gfo/Idh/MocA family oxidoreductase [Chthonomonadales bacterium]
MIRIGLVDFDTSHVIAFTERLNHINVPASEYVAGARVVAGCPGDSLMMPERIPPYAKQLANYGIRLVSKPEELLGDIDAVMIESQQGARHLMRSKPFLEAGLPTFVDKPFAETVAQADAMIRLAARCHAPLMSCSALRYAPEVIDAVQKTRELGPIIGADVWTTATLHPGNPGLLHYGIHGVEMLYTLLGAGCARVRCTSTADADLVVGSWRDGRNGTVRGIRKGAPGFGFVAHYEKGRYTASVEGSAYYREMLRTIVGMFTTKRPPYDVRVSREIIAFISAARRSAASGGGPRSL